MPLVSEALAQNAFDYFHNQGEAAAQAKADLIIAEYRRKKTRAGLIGECEEKTIALKEAWAECHEDYEAAIIVEAQAAKEVEWHRHMRARSEAILDAWRTEQASNRNLARAA